MYRRILPLAFALFAPSPLFGQSSPFEQGKEALEQEDYDFAIAAFTEAIQVNPKHAKSYAERANAYGKNGDLDRAIADCNQALRIDPRCAEAHCYRGTGYGTKKKYKECIVDLTEAIRLDPDYCTAYVNRAFFFIERKEHDRAIQDLTEAIRLDPKKAIYWYQRGLEYSHKKQYERAIADLTEAIRLNPNDASAWRTRGKAYMDGEAANVAKAGLLTYRFKAIEDFTEVIRLAPGDANAYYWRGAIYCTIGRQEGAALADLNEAIRLNPNLPGPYFHRAYVWSNRRDYAGAIADLSQSITLYPNATAYSCRARCYMNFKDYKHALTDLAIALKIDPKHISAYLDRSALCMATRDYGLVLTDLTEVIRLEPRNAEAYYNRSIAHMNRNEYSLAIEDMTEALCLNAYYAYCGALHIRGECYLRSHNYKRAMGDFTKIISNDPQNASAYAFRGAIYAAIKHMPAKARADLEKAISIDHQTVIFNQRWMFQFDVNYTRDGMRIEDYRNDGQSYTRGLSPNRALAWLLATHPEELYRDGRRALTYATRDCELSKWKNADALEVLAAARAEYGDFQEAIRWQKRAIELGFDDGQRVKPARDRLELYKQHKCYRGDSETWPFLPSDGVNTPTNFAP